MEIENEIGTDMNGQSIFKPETISKPMDHNFMGWVKRLLNLSDLSWLSSYLLYNKSRKIWVSVFDKKLFLSVFDHDINYTNIPKVYHITLIHLLYLIKVEKYCPLSIALFNLDKNIWILSLKFGWVQSLNLAFGNFYWSKSNAFPTPSIKPSS